MLKKKPRSISWIAATYVGLTVILTIAIMWLQTGLHVEGHPDNFKLSLLVLPVALFLATIASITVIVLTSIIENPRECIKRSNIAFTIVILVAILISSFFLDKLTISDLIIFAFILLLIFVMVPRFFFSRFGSQNKFAPSKNRKLYRSSSDGSGILLFGAVMFSIFGVFFAGTANHVRKGECEKPFKEIERIVATNYLNCQSDQNSHHGKQKKSAQFLETLGSSNDSPSKIKRSAYKFYLEKDLTGYSVDDCKVELQKRNSYFRKNIYVSALGGSSVSCFDDSSIEKLCQKIDDHSNCLIDLTMKQKRGVDP